MDALKRKRDDDGTVVTFYTPDRIFQRVYKGAFALSLGRVKGAEQNTFWAIIHRTIFRGDENTSADEAWSLGGRVHPVFSTARGKTHRSGRWCVSHNRVHTCSHTLNPADDDFEAFRHLARYVTNLDVSVFVGNGEPPIFSQQPLAEQAVCSIFCSYARAIANPL